MNDDLLDMTADERSLGKPVGNDLTERKMTIPLIRALDAGNDAFRDRIVRFYAAGKPSEIPGTIAAIAENGGLEATRAEIDRFVTHAHAALKPLAESTAKHELSKLADALRAPR
jgi:octaprenyl-diphosphate synthase